MFFFIAGATIGLPGNRRKSLKDYIVSRVKRLLVPYFCFSVISAAIKFIVLFIQKAFTSTIILKEIQEILTIGNGPVWFLMAMFTAGIAFEIIRACLLEKKRIIGSVIVYTLLGAALLFMQRYEADFSVRSVLRRNLLCVLEISVGYFLIKFVCRIPSNRRILVGCALFVIGSALTTLFDIRVSFKDGSASDILLALPIINMIDTGIALVLISAKDAAPKLNAFFSFFGKESLTVLVLHPIVLNCFSYPLKNRVQHLPLAMQAGAALLGIVIVTVIMIPGIRFFDKHCRWMVGK